MVQKAFKRLGRQLGQVWFTLWHPDLASQEGELRVGGFLVRIWQMKATVAVSGNRDSS